MKTIRIPSFPCPSCGAAILATANLTGGPGLPDDGDAGICASCFNVHLYEQTVFGLHARRLRDDEEWIKTDPAMLDSMSKLLGELARRGRS